MQRIAVVALATASLLCAPHKCFCQDRIEIGRTVGTEYLVTADSAALQKALQRTAADGTLISQWHIESVNAFHYIVGTGMHKGYRKLVAAALQYDLKTRGFYAAPAMPHVTCASAACDDCLPFKENGRIIGCNCKEKSTVSNQCNFTQVDQSTFYDQLKRALMMGKK